MSPKNRCDWVALVAAPMVALAMLAVSGCSGESPADAGTAKSAGAVEQIISKEEIAELRESSKTREEFRRELNRKLDERSGAPVKWKTVKGKPTPKKGQ